MASNDFSGALNDAVLASVKQHLRLKFGAMRHPDTGEFPTVVVYGNDLKDLRLSIEGSPKLLSRISEQMTAEEQEASVLHPVHVGPPKAFLSYATEDKVTAKVIASALMARGIDTWWAEWEIASGDSLRQKLDEGLGACTHFIVLLTPISIQKPWVRLEMDSALVRRIEGQAKFIPLRQGLEVRELPPTLAGMRSPELEELSIDTFIRDLANEIHGVSKKPTLGQPPSILALPATGYTKVATAIAQVFVSETETATFADPQKEIEALAELVDVSVEDIEDAVYELRDFMTENHGTIIPKQELFSQFDGYFMDWLPADDALRIAADLINDPTMPSNTADLCARYGWQPRRMNSALAYLLTRELIVDYSALDGGYNAYRVEKTDATRRFVKSRS